MYGPPEIPATGGGWFTISTGGAVLGAVTGNLLVLGLSLFLIGMGIFYFWRLRRGEKKLLATQLAQDPPNLLWRTQVISLD